MVRPQSSLFVCVVFGILCTSVGHLQYFALLLVLLCSMITGWTFHLWMYYNQWLKGENRGRGTADSDLGPLLLVMGPSVQNGLLLLSAPLPPIDTIWAMMIVWRTRGDYRTARAVLEAIIAFSAMHTYYEQLLQVKQICLCLTGFTSLCLDAYVFLCSLVFHCMHVVL